MMMKKKRSHKQVNKAENKARKIEGTVRHSLILFVTFPCMPLHSSIFWLLLLPPPFEFNSSGIHSVWFDFGKQICSTYKYRPHVLSLLVRSFLARLLFGYLVSIFWNEREKERKV